MAKISVYKGTAKGGPAMLRLTLTGEDAKQLLGIGSLAAVRAAKPRINITRSSGNRWLIEAAQDGAIGLFVNHTFKSADLVGDADRIARANRANFLYGGTTMKQFGCGSAKHGTVAVQLQSIPGTTGKAWFSFDPFSDPVSGKRRRSAKSKTRMASGSKTTAQPRVVPDPSDSILDRLRASKAAFLGDVAAANQAGLEVRIGENGPASALEINGSEKLHIKQVRLLEEVL